MWRSQTAADPPEIEQYGWKCHLSLLLSYALSGVGVRMTRLGVTVGVVVVNKKTIMPYVQCVSKFRLFEYAGYIASIYVIDHTSVSLNTKP